MVKKFHYDGHTYVLKKGTYANNGSLYVCLVDAVTGEHYADVTTNCEYNDMDSIVVSHNFDNFTPKKLHDDVINYLALVCVAPVKIGLATGWFYIVNEDNVKNIQNI